MSARSVSESSAFINISNLHSVFPPRLPFPSAPRSTHLLLLLLSPSHNLSLEPVKTFLFSVGWSPQHLIVIALSRWIFICWSYTPLSLVAFGVLWWRDKNWILKSLLSLVGIRHVSFSHIWILFCWLYFFSHLGSHSQFWGRSWSSAKRSTSSKWKLCWAETVL